MMKSEAEKAAEKVGEDRAVQALAKAFGGCVALIILAVIALICYLLFCWGISVAWNYLFPAYPTTFMWVFVFITALTGVIMYFKSLLKKKD